MSAEDRGESQHLANEGRCSTGLVRWPTCDVEVRVAGGFAHFVGDDALVDASVHVADGADDQAVHVADCSREQQPKKRVKTFYLFDDESKVASGLFNA